MMGIEFLVPDTYFASAGLIAGTFGANYMLFADWVNRYDRTAVTLGYSLRKRAIIIRSSDGWLAVIPYSQIERMHEGRKYCLLETKNGHYIPCPPQVMTGQLKEVPRKAYHSGKMIWAITFTLTMVVVFEAIDAVVRIMM